MKSGSSRRGQLAYFNAGLHLDTASSTISLSAQSSSGISLSTWPSCLAQAKQNARLVDSDSWTALTAPS